MSIRQNSLQAMGRFVVFTLLLLCSCRSTTAQLYTALARGGTVLAPLIGGSVSAVGDINGDGLTDLVVGSPEGHLLADRAGQILVLSGADASILHQIDGLVPSQTIGQCVRGLADVDGDGIPDFLGGSYEKSSNGLTTNGHVTVYSGQTGLALYSLDGNHADDRFGSAVCSLGDLDGDGRGDFAVSAPFDNTNGGAAGLVRVFSGATGSVLYTYLGDDPNDQMGQSIDVAGDVDNDGTNDLIIGIPGEMGPGGLLLAGGARVYSGATGAVIRSHVGSDSSAQLGYSVSAAGDINLDGFADYAVGSPTYDAGGGSQSDFGQVQIFSGADGTVLRSQVGLQTGDLLGLALHCIGDFNGDGTQELAVTRSVLASGAGYPAGKVFEIRSGTDGALLDKLQATNGMFTSFGIMADAMGDLNQDGFDDFVIGFPSFLRFEGNYSVRGLVQAYMAPGPVVRRVQSQGIQPRFALNWSPTSGDPQALTGTIQCAGATPGGNGLVVASLDGADQDYYHYIPIQVNIDPYFVVVNASFGFDALGSITFPGVNRQLPNLAGLHFHVQVFEMFPIISGSNALVFEFAP